MFLKQSLHHKEIPLLTKTINFTFQDIHLNGAHSISDIKLPCFNFEGYTLGLFFGLIGFIYFKSWKNMYFFSNGTTCNCWMTYDLKSYETTKLQLMTSTLLPPKRQENCKKSAVNHSTEKSVLLNPENLSILNI